MKRSREHYQAVTAGLSSGSDGQDNTLAAQKIGEWVDPFCFGSSGFVMRCFFWFQHARMISVGL